MLKKLADFMDCIWKILVQVIPRYNDSISSVTATSLPYRIVPLLFLLNRVRSNRSSRNALVLPPI